MPSPALASSQLDFNPLPPLPPGFSLHPWWMQGSEARSWMSLLLRTAPWEDHIFRRFGREIPMPRRICWYGPRPYRYSGIVHPARPMPPGLSALTERLQASTGLPFNAVLLNLYRDGQDSMGWHSDDDYPTPNATLASLSLGGIRSFWMRERPPGKQRWTVQLWPGSLLLMAPGTQDRTQHCVPKQDRAEPRINLTWRILEHGSPPL